MKTQTGIFVFVTLLLMSGCSPEAATYWSNITSVQNTNLSTELETYVLTEVLQPLPDLDYAPAVDGVADVIQLKLAGQPSPYWSVLTWVPIDQVLHREFILSIYTREQAQWLEVTQLRFREPSYVGLNPDIRQVDLDRSWYWIELSGLQGANIQTYQLITFDGQNLNVELTIEHDGAGGRLP
ncbi:MAG: hypothetical protein AAF629_34375 [Chloroflexota bacterium]